MKYLPTLNLWNPAIYAAIRNGQLKIQCGQWVKCGEDAKPARWVALRPCKTMWVAHSEGDRGTARSFPRLCQAAGKGKSVVRRVSQQAS